MASFVEELEDVIERTADWSVDIIKGVVEALTEGGRPFDTVTLSTEEQLDEYITYRGHPDKWVEWIQERASTIMQKLAENGVDKMGVESVHPYDIAFRLALQYSIDMEEKLGKLDDAAYANLIEQSYIKGATAGAFNSSARSAASQAE